MRPTVEIDGDRDRPRRGAAGLSALSDRACSPCRTSPRAATRRVIGRIGERVRRRRRALLDAHTDAVHNRTVFTLAPADGDLRPRARRRRPRRRSSAIDMTAPRRARTRGSARSTSARSSGRRRRARRRPRAALAVGRAIAALGLPVFLYGELASTPERARARLLPPRRPRRAAPADARRRARARPGPGRAAPDRGRDAGHRPAAAGGLQRRARGRRRSSRAARSPPSCASPAAACRACGRSRSSSAGADPDLDQRPRPGRGAAADVVERIRQLAAGTGAGRSRRSSSGLVPAAALDGYPDDVPIAGLRARSADDRGATSSARTRASTRRWPQTRKQKRTPQAPRHPDGSINRRRRSRPRNRQEATAQARSRARAGSGRPPRPPPPTWQRRRSTAALLVRRPARCRSRCSFGQPVGAAIVLSVICRHLLHPARLLHRAVLLQPPQAKLAQQRARSRPSAAAAGAERVDVRSFTVGPVAENSYIFRRDGSGPGADRRSRRRGDRLLGAIDELGVEARGDPAHPHPLRPRRRRRPGRPRDRRAGLLPRDRGAGPRRHHELRPLARLRPLRELGRRGDGQGRRAARARGLRDRRPLHPGPQPRPRHLRDPRRGARCSSGDVLFQGSVGRVDLPGRRLADPGREPPHAGRGISGGDDGLPGHMGITTLGAERATTLPGELAR